MEERKKLYHVLPISLSTLPSELVARGHGACPVASTSLPSGTAGMSLLALLWMWVHLV